MNGDTLIKVENVSKKYCKSLRKSMTYGLRDIIRNSLGMSAKSEVLREGEFWALDDISFELKRGETLGLIGPNGAGKTTLLKMLNGIFWPDRGKISINGKVGALIEVGAGFHPALTGRDNIYVNAAILGMSKAEVDRKFDSIVAFANIGDFIDAPVKHYSSGMYVRLGFAVAVHCEPEILLVDEVLAVGDLSFRQKCFEKIAELLRRGVSVVIVSHDMISIQRICQKGIILNAGKLYRKGTIQEVIGDYYDLFKTSSEILTRNKSQKLVGSSGITYHEVKFYNLRGEPTRFFDSGEDIIAEWSFAVPKTIERPSLHFSLQSDDFTYNGYSTYYDGIKIACVDNNTIIRLCIKKAFLSPGEYIVSIGLWDENYIGAYFWDYHSTGTITIRSMKKMMGRFQFDHEWKIRQG